LAEQCDGRPRNASPGELDEACCQEHRVAEPPEVETAAGELVQPGFGAREPPRGLADRVERGRRLGRMEDEQTGLGRRARDRRERSVVEKDEAAGRRSHVDGADPGECCEGFSLARQPAAVRERMVEGDAGPRAGRVPEAPAKRIRR
jgi:hypothetical protein